MPGGGIPSLAVNMLRVEDPIIYADEKAYMVIFPQKSGEMKEFFRGGTVPSSGSDEVRTYVF